MACTRPLNAYRVNGKIFYTPSRGAEFIHLPCGQCVNCRLIAIPTLGLRWRVRNLQNCTMFTTVRSLMVEAGLWIPRTQRAPKIQVATITGSRPCACLYCTGLRRRAA